MPDWLVTPSQWTWWIAALVLIIAEVFAPATYLLWLGIGAALVGVVLVVAPGLILELQLAMFAIVSVLGIVASRWYLRRHPIRSDDPLLNHRAAQQIGAIATVQQAIVNGSGRIQLGDSTWRVIGPDLPAGSRVRVTGVEGMTLRVEHLGKS